MADRRLELDELTPGTVVNVMIREDTRDDFITRSGVVTHTDTGVTLCDDKGRVIFTSRSRKFVYIKIDGLEYDNLCFPAEVYGVIWYCTAKE